MPGAQIKKFAMEIEGSKSRPSCCPPTKRGNLPRHRAPHAIPRSWSSPDAISSACESFRLSRTAANVTPYTQLLRANSGLVEFIYPLNTDKFSSANPNGKSQD